MKIKLVSTVILLTMFFPAAFSQKLSIGVKAGTDLQKIKGKSFDEEFKFGYHVGAFAEIKVKKIGIAPEIYFSQTNAEQGKNTTATYIKKAKLSYMNIPILANLYFNDNVALTVGPQFGILVNENLTRNGNLGQSTQDAFKKGDFSLVGGLQVKILKLRVYGRYIIGLNDKNDLSEINDESSWKSQTIHLGIAYSFL